MLKFKQCLEKFKDINASSGLWLNVPTKWKLTCFMHKSALKYQCIFESLHLIGESYKYFPLDEE